MGALPLGGLGHTPPLAPQMRALPCDSSAVYGGSCTLSSNPRTRFALSMQRWGLPAGPCRAAVAAPASAPLLGGDSHQEVEGLDRWDMLPQPQKIMIGLVVLATVDGSKEGLLGRLDAPFIHRLELHETIGPHARVVNMFVGERDVLQDGDKPLLSLQALNEMTTRHGGPPGDAADRRDAPVASLRTASPQGPRPSACSASTHRRAAWLTCAARSHSDQCLQ